MPVQEQDQLSKDNLSGLSLARFHELMKKYPEQKKNKEAISGLAHMADCVLQHYSKDKCQLEQFLATHLAKNGKDNKGRACLVFSLRSKQGLMFFLELHGNFCDKGVALADLKAAMRTCKIPSVYVKVITNLPFLGVPVLTVDGQWNSYVDQNRDWKTEKSVEKENKQPKRPDDMPEFVKWCPNVYHFVKEMVENPNSRLEEFVKIDIKQKPVTRDASKQSPNLKKPSFILFMTGGLTFGEVKFASILTRHFEKTGKNTLVIFGTSQLISPNDFLENMNSIEAMPKKDSDQSLGSQFSVKNLFQSETNNGDNPYESSYDIFQPKEEDNTWTGYAEATYNDYCHNQ